MNVKEKIVSLAIKYNGDYRYIQKAIQNEEEVELVKQDNVITIFDKEYPKNLFSLDYPPYVLFYKGNKELLKEKMIGVVGSRNPCEYALKATKQLCKHYKDKVVISGLAKGIDACSHENAYKTIGVIGCGIDYIYPYCNKYLYEKLSKDGLIISEYPGITPPYAYHFPFRNRLIAALANEIYIMEAQQKSGTLTTINQAQSIGKDVKVLPFDVFNSSGIFNNQLIEEGAQIISNEDLFD